MDQEKIIKIRENKKAVKEDLLSIIKIVSPGTPLRNAIDGILRSRKGGLIVVENSHTNKILDGGFKLNTKFTSQRLIELAKMDGAIILSNNMKRIMHANVTLMPDNTIQTTETGTRHKAAERTAKMTGALTIAISERKNQIHLYYKEFKYHVRNKSEVLRVANETLQILEKQRELFDRNLDYLNFLEMRDDINIQQAAKVIQKGKIMQGILKLNERTILELGNESVAIKLRIKEIMRDVEKETDLVIKDYTNLNPKRSKNLLDNLSYEELIDTENIMLALAQNGNSEIENFQGWRILSKTHLSEKEISSLLKDFNNLLGILRAKKEDFVPFIGEEKAIVLEKDIERIKSR